MCVSTGDVIRYAAEEDIKFIRLAFCGLFGKQKNIAVMPSELERAFTQGIAFDASAIKGFGSVTHSDLLLFPEPETLTVLPWRPDHGKVARMFCEIRRPDGRAFECDTRTLLKNAVRCAEEQGIRLMFGARQRFVLYKRSMYGEKTVLPYDNASYMDIAPTDRGEDIRRQICLTLEQMGIFPESSHHDARAGHNVINLRRTNGLRVADNILTFHTVARTAADSAGLSADICTEFLLDGMTITAENDDDGSMLRGAAAGIGEHLPDVENYLGKVSARLDEGAQSIRLAAESNAHHCPLTADPYLAFTLLIKAALDGQGGLKEPHGEAFLRNVLPKKIIDICNEQLT